MAVQAKVTGLAAAKKAFKQSLAAAKKAAQAASRKAASVVVKSMKSSAPVGKTKNLKKRIKVTKPKRMRRDEIAASLAKATAPHAHLVEQGTKARKTKSGKSTGRGTANAFAERAANASRSQAHEAFKREFAERLQAETAKIAKG